jgi:hypothetical protein
VPEAEIGQVLDRAAALQDAEVGVESDFPQGDHNPKIREQFEFAFEEGAAVAEFFGRWLIVRWRAVGGGGDPGVEQAKSVFGVRAFGL